MIISEELHGFLIGCRFVDAGFVKKSLNHNTYIVFTQCEKQLNYLKWKFNYLKQNNCLNDNMKINCINQKTRKCYKNAQLQYKFLTFSASEFNYYKNTDFINLIPDINELGLATYLLDDGNFYKKICKISCSNTKYNSDFYNEFIKILYNKFNIKSHIYINKKNETKNYIRIPATEFYTLEEIIKK